MGGIFFPAAWEILVETENAPFFLQSLRASAWPASRVWNFSDGNRQEGPQFASVPLDSGQ